MKFTFDSRIDSSGQFKLVAMVAAAGAIAAAGTARAAVVSFLAPVRLAADGSNVVAGGTVLAAVNYGTSATTTPVTFKGITFTPAAPASLNGPVATTLTATQVGRAGGYAASDAVYPLVYENANTGADFTNAFVTLAGLTVGQQYRVQLIFSAGGADTHNRFTSISSGSASPLIEYGAFNSSNSPGVTTAGFGGPFIPVNGYSTATDNPAGAQLLVGTFTADGATQVFNTQNAQPGNRPSIAGYVVQSVPEPASLGGIAVAGMALLARRRRGV